MNRIIIFLLSIICTTTALAEDLANGYYRVQSTEQLRYASIIDNRGSINISTTSADMSALRTVLGFERVVSDPSTIIYIRKMNSGYDLESQGTGSYAIISYEVRITSTGEGTYWAYASKSGLTKYLADQQISWMWAADDIRRIYGEMVGIGSPKGDEADWNFLPVTTDGNNYFGITPSVTVGDSYYHSFYASFPYTLSSTGMNAYYVTKVDEGHSAVVIQELTGGVPQATPVIVKCASAQPVNNKLDVGASTSGNASGNLLKGVYFCNDVDNPGHRNVVNYNPSTMRVLGTASDGSLAFVKTTLKVIPANTAYLTVSADAPDELKVYTPDEYEQLIKEPVKVQVTLADAKRQYGEANPAFTYTVQPEGIDLSGKLTISCSATNTSNVGVYDITATAASVEGLAITVTPGKLTITPAALKVSVKDAQRQYGAADPAFEVTYAGFVNNETEAVLTEKATVTPAATKTSGVGTYKLTASGGKATNYTFSEYVDGNLTITPTALKVSAKDATRQYGADNPAFEATYEGFVNGETEAVLTEKATVTTEATKASGVGTYKLTVSGGKAANYTFKEYADGQLTITPATLKASVKDATRPYGTDNPAFEMSYAGFVNNETEAVLTEQAVITTEATKTSNAGTYKLTATGGKAANYIIESVDGQLTITPIALKVIVKDATRQYGAADPAFEVAYAGFINDETEAVLTEKPSVTSEATKTSNVGTYKLTVSGGKATNYTFSEYADGQLTITPAALAVSVKDATRSYGTDNPAFEVAYAGFVNDETESVLTEKAVVTTEAKKSSDVGTYKLTVSGGKATNYTFSDYKDGQLTITKVPLTITALNDTLYAGTEISGLAYICEGFVNDDDESALTTKPQVTTTATKDSPIGDYEITVSGAVATNYEISYVGATLTLVKKIEPNESFEYISGNYEVQPDYTVTFNGINEWEDTYYDVPEIVFNNGYSFIVNAIAPEAFKNNTNLEEIYIPESIESIGDEAFVGCINLKTLIVCMPEPIEVDASIFEGIDFDSCVLIVFDSSVDLYKQAPVWKEFKTILPFSSLRVNGLSADSHKADIVYDLRGRKVGTTATLKQLPKGIYIVNGRKVMP